MMKKTLCSFVAFAFALSGISGAGAAAQLKRLGEDPAGDGPVGLDLTYLDVGRHGADMHIRIGVEMVPGIAGYPELPGIEWTFKVGGRTFIAEGVSGSTPTFYLFEQTADGFTQLDSPTGTYSADDGFIDIFVPLKTIGAKRGSVVTGVENPDAGGDVDAHVHIGAATEYPDAFTTTKSIKL